MKKNKNKFHFFENAWTNHTGDREMTAEDLCEAKKKRRSKITIAIVSLMFAFLIWGYASSVSVTEIKFQSASVTVKRLAAVESKGYKVEYNNNVKVNYTISGKTWHISQLPLGGADIYVDLSTVNLSEITDMKIVQLPLMVDLPAEVSCTEKSQEFIEVIITKNSVES
ncbi:MAG: hypothetical protein IKM00_10230 [Clostridia bacterium]|nr:hypothetical protein [Clostridia bacterium]